MLETRTAVQIAIVYNYLGFMILPLFVALDRIEGVLREASKDLGAGRIATFARVTLPLGGPGIAAGVLLTFIPMCGDYVTATVLGGAKGNMIGALIDSQFKGAQNWPLGSAIAVLMIGAVLAVLAIGALVVFGTQFVLRMRELCRKEKGQIAVFFIDDNFVLQALLMPRCRSQHDRIRKVPVKDGKPQLRCVPRPSAKATACHFSKLEFFLRSSSSTACSRCPSWPSSRRDAANSRRSPKRVAPAPRAPWR